MKRAPIQIQKMKSKNHLWLFIPTQLFIQGQWWSMFITHCWHKEQWWPLIGFGNFHGFWGESSSGTGHSHFLQETFQCSIKVEYFVFLYLRSAPRSLPTPAGFNKPVCSSSFISTLALTSSVYQIKWPYVIFTHKPRMRPHCFKVTLNNTK